jgi:hypothetical protein
MRQHQSECPRCSALDTRVRRSLLVARNNAPEILISPDFGDRLARRLADEKRTLRATSEPMGLKLPLLLVACAVLVVAGGLATIVGYGARGSLNPPVARYGPNRVEITPAFLSTVSTGMAIVPAVLLVEEFSPQRVDPVNAPAETSATGIR